jgi:hypothetical protein
MKIHHFIISYDSISKQWVHDIDQEEIHYNDGTICTQEIDEEIWADGTVHKYEGSKQWSGGYLGDGKYNQEDADLCEKINDALEQLNKTNT